jgi:hypothetical protein
MSGLYHYHLSAKFACLHIFSLYFSDITSKIQRPTLSLIISCRDGIESGGYKGICVVVSWCFMQGIVQCLRSRLIAEMIGTA